MASLVCAIESIRSLRCVVRNAWRVSSSSNCSIAIMLTGAQAIDLRAQGGDRTRRRSSRAPRRAPAAVSAASAGAAPTRRPRFRRLRAHRRPASGSRQAVALPSVRRRPSTSSSVACTASTHVCARWVRSASAVARATSSCAGLARGRLEHAPRARGCASCASKLARSAGDRFVGRAGRARAGRRARECPRRGALRRPRSPSRSSLDPRRRAPSALAGVRRCADFELARRLLRAARLRRPARRPARRGRRAPPGFGGRGA